MKTIGFIDYYLDEWHANNYPKMLKDASEGKYEVCYAYGKIDSTIGGITNAAWAEKYGVELLSSIEEVIEKFYNGTNFYFMSTKGKKVYVSGDLGLHTWQTKEGQSRTDILCYVDFVEFCGSKAEQEQKNVNVPFENQQRAQRVNDDLFGGQVSTNDESWL